MGRHFVHRLIGLEARAGLALSIQSTELIALPGETPCRVIGANNNTVEKLDGMHGEDQ